MVKSLVVSINLMLLLVFFPPYSIFAETANTPTDSLREEIGGMYGEIVRLFELSEYHEALKVNRKQKALIIEHLGKKDSLYGTSLNSMAVLLRRSGDSENAILFYREAISHALEIHGKEHPEYGIRIGNLALYYDTEGRFDDAIPLYYEALEAIKNRRGINNQGYALILNNLGSLYRKLGQYRKSVELLEEALEIQKELFGELHPRYATVLLNLANGYNRKGEYVKALNLSLQSLEINRQNYGENHHIYGLGLNDLGMLYSNLGQFDRSLECLYQALEIAENYHGKLHLSYAGRLTNIASIYKRIGKLTKAHEYYKISLEINEGILGPMDYRNGPLLNNIAGVLADMGRYEEAFEFYKKTLEVTEQSLGKNNRIYALRIYNVGCLYLLQEDYNTAREYFSKSISIISEQFGEYHHINGPYLTLMASSYLESGIIDSALVFYLKANEILSRSFESVVGIGSEQQKIDYLNLILPFFEQLKSFAFRSGTKLPELNKAIFENSLQINGLVLNSSKNLYNQILRSSDPQLISLYEEWSNLKDRIGKEYSKALDEQYSKLDSLIEVAEAWEGELVRKSNVFASMLQYPNWKEIRGKLGRHEIAIEFSHFRIFKNSVATDSIMYSAIIIASDSKYPEIIPLFEEGELKKFLARQKGQSEIDYINKIYGDEDYFLYNLMFKHIEEHLRGKRTVYYSPSGLLLQINFNAIPHPGANLSGELFQFNRLMGLRSLLVDYPPIEIANFWLAGGIKYDSGIENSITEEAGQRNLFFKPNLNNLMSDSVNAWQYLSGSLAEVKSIKTLVPKKVNVVFLSDEEASEESFKELSGNSPDVIHIATHGFFSPNFERNQLEPFSLNVDNRSDYFENPLFRTGLIMANANYSWIHGNSQQDSEDGILTAYEISRMDLSGTSLVVLSACETGLGDIYGTEGVYGLQRGFMLAGVDYIIMSLWKVPDEQTSELMESFYSNWFSGMSIREAFTTAQREMATQYPPFYWGAFILVGGGKEEIAYSGLSNQPWSLAIYGLLLLIAIIVFGAMLKRNAFSNTIKRE